MPTCDMGYEHESAPETPAEPEVIVTQPETNEHDVEIARARAEAQVEETKAYAKARDPEQEAEIARLRGEIDGLRTAMAAMTPPEPEVIVAEPPAPAPETVVEAPSEPAPPDNPSPPVPSPKKKPGFWDAYKG
jgi:hypothetical protein